MSSKTWRHLGICHVDAGMLLVGDPCYSAHDSHPEHPIHHWKAFVERLPDAALGLQLDHPHGGAGCGVVVCTGGDGQYTVEARFNAHGELLEARIRPDRSCD